MATSPLPTPCRPADLAREALQRCDLLATASDQPGQITRTYLSPATRQAHDHVRAWMTAAGLAARLDAAGNLVGRRAAAAGQPSPRVLLVGSHLDTVPNAGRYDGILGVMLGLALVQALGDTPLPFHLDVIGFSEEEGVRFHTPFLGSLAAAGRFDAGLLDRRDADGVSVADAIRAFGLDPGAIPQAAYRPGEVLAYLEAHIEQGPVLDGLDAPVGVVESIAGQSRLKMAFTGQAGHAGTLPMDRRRDALAAAAEFLVAAESIGRATDGLRVTAGVLTVEPGVVNVVPGRATLTLDIRHGRDAARHEAVTAVQHAARRIAALRGVEVQCDLLKEQAAVACDAGLSDRLADAVRAAGQPVHSLVSGAGHDAMVLADLAPVAMLFVRSPGGISHHPDEAVHVGDVAVAIDVLVRTVLGLAQMPPAPPVAGR